MRDGIKIVEIDVDEGGLFYVGGLVTIYQPKVESDVMTIAIWCYDQFGPGLIGGDPNARWSRLQNRFEIFSDIDATAFKLVWL